MSNLFSIFDPRSAGFPLLWLAAFSGIFFMVASFWPAPSYGYTLFKKLGKSLASQFGPSLATHNHPGIIHWAASVFLFIALLNGASLLPYVFAPTAHLSLTLALGLTFWAGYVSYGAFKSPTPTLAHLIPEGTPAALQPFMALVESISSLIRPATLSVRLAANMVAGHLLIALLTSSSLGPAPMGGALLLLTLESLVAGVQAYVFVLLSILYLSETNAHSTRY